MKWLWRHIDNSFKQALPLRKLHYKAKSGDQRTIDTVYINAIYPPAPRQAVSDAKSGGPPPGFARESPLSPNAPPNPLNWHKQPYLDVFLVRCEDMDQYRARVKRDVDKFVQQMTTRSAQRAAGPSASSQDKKR